MSTEQVRERAIRLRDGLRSEQRVYEGLLEITRRQKEILLSGRTEEILQLARSKEAVLGRIDAIERDLVPLKESWPELRDQVGSDLRDEIEQERTRLQDVLKGLIELEEEGQRSIDRLRQETADKLRQVEGGRRVQQAYTAPAAARSPRYLDRTQ